MKNPFRRKEGMATPGHQEPRLAGFDEPKYSPAAKDAFIEVLLKVPATCRPPGTDAGFTDAATDLKRAIQAADLYCNAELTGRMNALWEAAVQESMGGGSPEATRAAQQHFTVGCRLALGTND